MGIDHVYKQIVDISGEPSIRTPGEVVWVPAMANGGLRQLLSELDARGWVITPPSSVPWFRYLDLGQESSTYEVHLPGEEPVFVTAYEHESDGCFCTKCGNLSGRDCRHWAVVLGEV